MDASQQGHSISVKITKQILFFNIWSKVFKSFASHPGFEVIEDLRNIITLPRVNFIARIKIKCGCLSACHGLINVPIKNWHIKWSPEKVFQAL